MTAPEIRDKILKHLDWLEGIANRATAGPWYVRRVGTGIRGGPGNYAFLTNSAPDERIRPIAEKHNAGTEVDMDFIAMVANPVVVLRGIQVDREVVSRHGFGILIGERRLCIGHIGPNAPWADECPEILAIARRRGLVSEQ